MSSSRMSDYEDDGLMSLCGDTDYLLDFASFAQDPLPVQTMSPTSWGSLTTSASVSSDDDKSIVKRAKMGSGAATFGSNTPVSFHMGATTTANNTVVPSNAASRDHLFALNGFPKIFRTDIRRQYARMFANVMNSADGELMSSFVKRYTRPDVSMHKQSSTPHHMNPLVQPGISQPCPGVTLAGRDLISIYWNTMTQFTVDHVVRIEEVQMKSRVGSLATKLCCKFSARSTIMYDIQMEDVVGKLQAELAKLEVDPSTSLIPLQKVSEENSSKGGKKKIDLKSYDATKLLANKHGMLPMLPTPVSLEVDGTFTLYIDEQKRIEKFDFVAGRQSIRDVNCPLCS